MKMIISADSQIFDDVFSYKDLADTGGALDGDTDSDFTCEGASSSTSDGSEGEVTSAEGSVASDPDGIGTGTGTDDANARRRKAKKKERKRMQKEAQALLKPDALSKSKKVTGRKNVFCFFL